MANICPSSPHSFPTHRQILQVIIYQQEKCKAKNKNLEFLARKEDIGSIGITEEQWKDKNQQDIVMPGYEVYRKDRLGHRAGGVAQGLYYWPSGQETDIECKILNEIKESTKSNMAVIMGDFSYLQLVKYHSGTSLREIVSQIITLNYCFFGQLVLEHTH